MNFKISSLGKLTCVNQETGESFDLGNIQTPTVDVEPINNQIQYINRKPKPITFFVENAQWNLNNIVTRELLKLPISNNWRKMHGYPMQQRKR